MTVQEIELAIVALSPEQKLELHAWMDELYAQMVDDRLEADVLAGRFDALADRALTEHKAGKTRLL